MNTKRMYRHDDGGPQDNAGGGADGMAALRAENEQLRAELAASQATVKVLIDLAAKGSKKAADDADAETSPKSPPASASKGQTQQQFTQGEMAGDEGAAFDSRAARRGGPPPLRADASLEEHYARMNADVAARSRGSLTGR